jgi:hypothetical protein
VRCSECKVDADGTRGYEEGRGTRLVAAPSVLIPLMSSARYLVAAVDVHRAARETNSGVAWDCPQYFKPLSEASGRDSVLLRLVASTTNLIVFHSSTEEAEHLRPSYPLSIAQNHGMDLLAAC